MTDAASAKVRAAAKALAGKVISLPTRDAIGLPINEQLIVELYSK